MDMKDFAKYIKDKSFDEELHKSRRKSLERIIDSESYLEKKTEPEELQTKKTA